MSYSPPNELPGAPGFRSLGYVTGATTDYVKCNFSATAYPTPDNDTTEGYEIGSQWVNGTDGTLWICYDASTGVALWKPAAPVQEINAAGFGLVGDGIADDTVPLTNAIAAAAALFASSVYTANRRYVTCVIPGSFIVLVTSTVTIPVGVRLHCAGGMIVNGLSNIGNQPYLPCLKFLPQSHCGDLNLWGNFRSGIQLGAVAAYSDMEVGNIRMWNMGSEFDPTYGPKIAVQVLGYDFEIATIQSDGGNIALDLNGCSDVRIGKALLYAASVALRITSGSEHIHLPALDIDSCNYMGMQIDSCDDVNIRCGGFFNDQVPGVAFGVYSSGYFARLGHFTDPGQKVNNVNLDLAVCNTNGIAVSLDNIQGSRINLNANNGTLLTGNAHPTLQGVEYGTGVDRDVLVDGISSVTTVVSGPSQGNLRVFDSTGLGFLEEAYSVLQFGAIGDGTTDDSDAFIAAINAADASTTIKTVFVPHRASGYAIGAIIPLPGGVVLRGQNYKGGLLSRLKPVGGFTDPILQTKDYGVTRQLKLAVIGLCLDGSSTTNTMVDLQCQESVIRDCTILNCYTYGIHISGVGSGANQQALNNQIKDNYLQGSGGTSFYDGIFLDYHTADTTLLNNYIEQGINCAIRSFAYNDVIEGNHLYNWKNHYLTATSNDKIFAGNYCEKSTYGSVIVQGGANDNLTLAAVISNNVFRNINTSGSGTGIMEFSSTYVDSLSVTGNVVRRDGSTSYAATYFAWFNGITPTNANISGNQWENGTVSSTETNLVPAIAAGAGAGTSPTISISGNDKGGTVSLTTGSSPSTSAVIATITLAVPLHSAPPVIFTPANAATAALTSAAPYGTSTASTAVLNANGAALTGATAYKWNYRIG